MTCSDFVTRFSEYFDGATPEEFTRQAEAHLAGCSSCRRYQRVFERGRELLAAMPSPQLNEDFAPRLQHRLYMVDHEAVLRRHTSSGTVGFAVLGIAVLLAGVAWSATLRATAPVVDLAPIVVSRPPVVLRFPAINAYPFDRGLLRRPASSRALWDDANGLLLQYSPLSRRYGQQEQLPLRRAGLEEDR